MGMYVSYPSLPLTKSLPRKQNLSLNIEMDSLLAFWPGLQVLWGDVDAAIHTHDMLYHVTERHNFLPEAFTLDFRVHWGNHPLRPEFSESTYFLYKVSFLCGVRWVCTSCVETVHTYSGCILPV